MPYTIHTAKAKIRDAQDHYRDIDVFSDDLEGALEAIGRNNNQGARGAAVAAVQTIANNINTNTANQLTDASAVANMVAQQFNAANTYKKGDYVRYTTTSNNTTINKLYKLTADHAANVTWENTSKVEVNLSNDVSDLKSAVGKQIGVAVTQANNGVNASTQFPNDTGAYFSKSSDAYGNYNLQYQKTRGYVYISPILGLYTDIFDSEFLVEITSNADGEAHYEILLCRGPEWGTSNTGVIFSGILNKGHKAYYKINMSDYDSSIWVSNAYVYMIVRNQSYNNDGKLVNLDIHIIKNPSLSRNESNNAEISNNIKSVFNSNPDLLIPFDDVQWLYKGSNSPVLDNQAESGALFEGFNRLGSPSSGTIAIAKKINTNVLQIPVLTDNNNTITLDVYIDFNTSVYPYMKDTLIFLSSNIDWNNTRSVAYKTVTVVPGWNKISLDYRSYNSSQSYYKYFIVQQGYPDYNNLINAIYVRPAVDNLVFKSSNSDLAINSKNAGFRVNEYEPFKYVVGTLSSGTITYTTSPGKVTFNCSSGVTASGQCYPVVAYPIKHLFGLGVKLRFTVTNQAKNSNTWYWNTCRFCQVTNSWGGANTIQAITLSELGDMLAESSTFTIDLDTFATFTPSNYNKIFFLIASFRNSPVSIPANKISVEMVVLDKDNRVLATELLGFNQNNYYTKAQVDAVLPTYQKDLLFWGDSLTAGAGGDGTTYPGVCAEELGNLTYLNCGVGGETANTIAARQGGNMIIIPPGAVNGTYALNDLTDIFGYHVNPLRQGNGNNSGNKLYINGYEANLAITQSSATAQDATYTISGYDGPNLIVPTFARFAGCSFNGKIVIIWVGQNGSSVEGISDGVDARIAIIDSMISHIGHERYVILGMSSGSTASRDTEDKKLLAKYGNKFFPTRKLLANYGMTLLGLTPKSTDETEMTAGSVPGSLRYDNVHLNANGYTALGKFLAQKIKALGYV